MPKAVHLRCPECHDPEALTCAIVCIQGTIDVTLGAQTCACDPYANWDEVWEQARDLVHEGGLE